MFFPFSRSVLSFRIYESFVVFFFSPLYVPLYGRPKVVGAPSFVDGTSSFLSVYVGFRQGRSYVICQRGSVPRLYGVRFQCMSIRLYRTIVSFVGLSSKGNYLLRHHYRVFVVLVNCSARGGRYYRGGP